jgi:hypothetical protein
MELSRNRLYSIIFIACLAGYIWLFINSAASFVKIEPVGVCLVKHATSIPCPSCGSTRSIISITKGNFVEALRINPLGYIVAIIMLLAPLWILLDIVTKRKTLLEFYHKMEIYLKRPQFAIPIILSVIINWVWNITKGL